MMRLPVKPIALAAAIALAVPGAAASAQDAVKLEGAAKLMAREVDEHGRMTTKLVDPVVVVPGDRILFTTAYRNVSGRTLTNFVVTNPVPATVELVADGDPALVVSVDGGKTWGLLPDLTVADGATSTRPARASDVTHLRWVIKQIAPNQTGQVEFVAVVR